MSRSLPARVQREVEREQFRSELLVAAVQLALAALLASLDAAFSEGYAPDAPVKAVPLGLAWFTLLVLLRLYAAWTGQLGALLLGAGVVAETAVLLAVIVLQHLQYEQPPPFSVKSSAFVYLFALIALRALRFEPRWVWLAGGSALAGWALLVVWAVHAAPANPITWDLVTAHRSAQIHWGAEFDKLLALAVFTAALAFALARARRLLERSARERHAVADLSRFFDAGVAQRITGRAEQPMAGDGESRRASIVFFDLRGFSAAAARMTPAELIALLGEYQRLVVPIVRRHRGSIDKFMGDGILASFGAVAADPAHAAQALRAVDEILLAAQDWQRGRAAAGQPAPGIGAGAAVGEVVFGVIGDDTRLEYTVIGDAVNLAAKLEKHNKAEGTKALASAEIWRDAVMQGYADPRPLRPARRVAGVEAPVDLVVMG